MRTHTTPFSNNRAARSNRGVNSKIARVSSRSSYRNRLIVNEELEVFLIKLRHIIQSNRDSKVTCIVRYSHTGEIITVSVKDLLHLSLEATNVNTILTSINSALIRNCIINFGQIVVDIVAEFSH